MSAILQTGQTHELSSKEKEYFCSPGAKDDYNFKYIPESHFRHIIKTVQRQRCKENEERVWVSFVKEHGLNNLRLPKKNAALPGQSVSDLLTESMQDVDRELKRLEEDALPEPQSKRIYAKAGIRSKTFGARVNNMQINSPKKKPVRNNDICDTNLLNPTSGVSRTNAKKSLSDPSIVRKKHYARELLCATNNFENNFSPELTTQRDTGKGNIIYVRPDPLTIHKILSMQKKIAELLDEISFRLCRIPLPDGDNDIKRRQQRAVEFSIRFSRNYLYDLNRFVTSIRGHIAAISPRAGPKHNHKSIVFHREAIEQKMVAVHQLLLHALSAYSSHIPSSIFKGDPTKLKQVLRIVVELKDICEKVQISANFVGSGDANVLSLKKELEEKCDAILSQLTMDAENERRPVVSYNNAETMANLVALHRRKRCDRKNSSTRLSMYSVDTKASKTDQKKRNEQRKKNRSYQKEEKSTEMGTKGIRNEYHLTELQYPSPATYTSSSRGVTDAASTKHAHYLQEDDIRTMMDGIPLDSENDSNLEAESRCSNATTEQRSKGLSQGLNGTEVRKQKSLRTKQKNVKGEDANGESLIKKVTTITEKHLSTLVPVIADLMTLVSKKNELQVQPIPETSMETLLEFLQNHQSPKDFDPKVSPHRCTRTSENNCKCSRLDPNEINFGLCEAEKPPTNMQLICMSSMGQNLTTQHDASCQVNCETGTATINKESIDSSSEIQLIVSEKTEQRLVEYRREYQRLCQSKPMYSSSTQNKPWDVVAWISDKLVEELISEISKELQMSDVIQKLFEMEFLEF